MLSNFQIMMPGTGIPVEVQEMFTLSRSTTFITLLLTMVVLG